MLRPREPEKVTPQFLFLSYQSEPGGKMLDPEKVSSCSRTTKLQLPDSLV
jgi:hypothetical protein